MFNLVDSLRYLALTKVCTSLFTCKTLLAFEWTPKVNLAIRLRTDVPETLKYDMILEVERLYGEIEKFRQIVNIYRPICLADHIVWNADGSIDVAKSCASAVESDDCGYYYKKIVAATCDEEFLRGKFKGNPKKLFRRLLHYGNPFAVKYFWKQNRETELASYLTSKSDEVSRFLFSKCSQRNKHLLVPFVLGYYRVRNRFERFERNFWNELDFEVKERFLDCLVLKYSDIFYEYRDEEILFFASRMSICQRRRLLDRLVTDLVVTSNTSRCYNRFRLLSIDLFLICRKKLTSDWIAKCMKWKDSPSLISDILTCELTEIFENEF